MLKFAKYLKTAQKKRSPEEIKNIIDNYNEEKRRAGEKSDLSLLQRLLLGSTGLGMVRGNVHPVLSAIRGNADLWHGSAPENLMMADGKGILNEGLSLAHAGKNKRLNADLMKNSPMTIMEEFLNRQNKRLTPEDENYLEGIIGEISRGTKSAPDNFLDLDLLQKAYEESKSSPENIIANFKKHFGRDPLDEELRLLQEVGSVNYSGEKPYSPAARKRYSSRGISDGERILAPHDYIEQKYRNLGYPEGAFENLSTLARDEWTKKLSPSFIDHPLIATPRDSEAHRKIWRGLDEEMSKRYRAEVGKGAGPYRGALTSLKAKEDFKSLFDKVKEKAPLLAKRFGVDQKQLEDYIDSNAHKLGRRIYFATNPQSVAFWSGKQTEGDFLTEKMVSQLSDGNSDSPFDWKRLLRATKDALLNQATGGYYETYLANKKYGKPETTIHVKDLEALKNYFAGMSPEEQGKIKTLMQFSVPSGTLDSMADFPVVRRVVQSSPGVKEMMGTFLPQSDPSKDLSIHEAVSPNNLKTMDIIDSATGKLKTRIHVDSHNKAPFKFLGGAGNRWNNFKNMAAPLGILGTGGYMMYKALKPAVKSKQTIADKIPDVQEKKASVSPGTMAKLISAPLALSSVLAGGAYLSDKLTNKKNYVPIPEELSKKFTQAEKDQYDSDAAFEDLKSGIGSHLTNVAGTTAGTLATPLSYSPLTAWLGTGGAAMAGGIGGNIGLAEADADAIIPGVSYIPGAEKFIREHPYVSAAATGGVGMAALPATAYYTMKKYYPYSSSSFFNSIKDLHRSINSLEEFSEKNKSFLDKLKMRAKGLKMTTLIPIMTLLGAASKGLGMYGARKAKQKINENLSSEDEQR
jgi:hypothetical protein